MSIVNFIELHNSLDDACSIRVSPMMDANIIKSIAFKGVQLLPNNEYPYVQTTNNPNGVELEDWTVYVVDFCDNETDITDYFMVERVFSDDNGTPQIEWSLTNVPFDFGYNDVYLRIEQTLGETFYTNPFRFTENESDKTTRLDYKDEDLSNMQSIQVTMYFWQTLISEELTTYYQVSTGNTVSVMTKNQKFERWLSDLMPNDTFIKINDALNSKYKYLDLVRAYKFEGQEVKDHQASENFAENELKISFNRNDVYDPSYEEPIEPTTPTITLNSVIANGVSAIYNFSYSDFTTDTLTFQRSQDNANWSSTNAGVTSPQSISFAETGTWYFRIIHPEAISNTITLELSSPVDAINDNVQVEKGQFIDISVLTNDLLVGNTTITEVSTPTNGTSQIIESGTKIRYTHNDSLTSFDTFTYTISNGISSDTATVSVLITDAGSSTQFSLSESANNASTACLLPTGLNKYHNGENALPVEADFVFEDAGLLTPFNGNNKYYAIGFGKYAIISVTGEVLTIEFCSAQSSGDDEGIEPL